MNKYITNKLYDDGFDVYKCIDSNSYHAILVCIQDNQGNDNERAYKVEHESLTNRECFKQGVSIYCWYEFHRDMVTCDEPHPKLKLCDPKVDKYLFEKHNTLEDGEVYQSYSQSYENDVLYVRLKDGSHAKLLEITWVPCKIDGHKLEHAIIGVWDPRETDNVPKIIPTSEISFPEPFLITSKTRKIIAENNGDLESVEGDANFLCIYG